MFWEQSRVIQTFGKKKRNKILKPWLHDVSLMVCAAYYVLIFDILIVMKY